MFLQPEKVPVKVYLSTDKDAPRLDRTPNCLQTILKACLVTGYGDKEGAGWSLPFEDTAQGIKVFRPEISPHTDFFMKVGGDNGREATIQVLQEMSNIDDGELKLQCDTPFKYGVGNPISGKWAVIACGRAFWLFHETGSNARNKDTQVGTYLYCGDTAKNTRGERAIYLRHTGGTWGISDIDRYSLLYSGPQTGGLVNGKLLDVTKQSALNVNPQSFFDGKSTMSGKTLLAPILIMANNEIWALPAFSPSIIYKDNGEEVVGYGRTFINHSSATNHNHNLYVPIDYWEF